MPNAFWEDVSNALAVARNGSRQLVDLMCSSAIVAWMEGEGMDPDTVPVEDGEGLTVIFWGIAALAGNIPASEIAARASAFRTSQLGRAYGATLAKIAGGPLS